MISIPAEAKYALVYSVEEFELLGPVIEPHIVQLTSSGNLSLQSQRIHINNADYYGKVLDEIDYKAIQLLSDITPEALTKKFSKTPRVRPKDFFSLKSTQELIDKFIRPYIDRKIAEVLTLIEGRRLFQKNGKHASAIELFWPEEEAEVLFHLRRNEDDIHYFPTIRYKEHRIEINRNQAYLLCLQPCYLVNSGQLYKFSSELDGNKIRPFLSKRFVSIQKNSELQFLKTFIVPLFEKHNLYAKGYEVATLTLQAIPQLKAGKLISGNCGFTLYFKYGKHAFPAHSSRHVSVTVEPRDDTYALLRVRRSARWEDQKKQVLFDLGIREVAGSEMEVPGCTSERELIGWIQTNRNTFDAAGFELSHTFNVNFNLKSSQLTLQYSEQSDWFDVHGTVNLCGYDIPFQEIARHIKAGKREYVLPDESVAILPDEWFERLGNLIDFSESRTQIRIGRLHSPLLTDAGLAVPSLHSDLNRVPEYDLPSGFRGVLRGYQKAGYDWLRFLDVHGVGGCLADDMGLGKTVQTLAFMQWLKEEGGRQNNDLPKVCLLVVPTSLVMNWISETSKFTPEIKVLNHTGPGRTDRNVDFHRHDLVITTYGTLRNDIDWICKCEFRFIALDESQMIKNPESKIAGVVTELRARGRITLTGTPVENSVRDLWSQMHFTNPGLLGTHRFFQKKFQFPVERYSSSNATSTLKKLISPFVLRRTKAQVASDLPDKTEQIVYCEMTEEQMKLYEQVKSQYRNMLIDLAEGEVSQQVKFSMLSGLTKLRLIANAPQLSEEGVGLSSGKFDVVNSHIETALEEGHKVLIFSQFVTHLSLYRNLLDSSGIRYAYLDGSTPQKQRMEQVDHFQKSDGCQIFLISLKAGGYGLNLTAADYVFLLDPWWNPAVENQAIDRTHRIGQSQKVFSYRFISADSIEEKILKLQERKRKLSDALIQTDESIYKSLNLEDLRELFS